MSDYPTLTTRSGRNPSQRADELIPFIDFMKERDVRSYLEIGARHGDTFHKVMTSLPKGSVGVAVDMPGGPWGKIGTSKYLDAAALDLRQQGYDATVIYGDSGSDWVFQRVSKRSYGTIFIDGDHTFEGVSRDWRMYSHLSTIVAFHDIAGEDIIHREFGQVEVPLLWKELKSMHETIEFIGAETGYGIGAVIR